MSSNPEAGPSRERKGALIALDKLNYMARGREQEPPVDI